MYQQFQYNAKLMFGLFPVNQNILLFKAINTFEVHKQI